MNFIKRLLRGDQAEEKPGSDDGAPQPGMPDDQLYTINDQQVFTRMAENGSFTVAIPWAFGSRIRSAGREAGLGVGDEGVVLTPGCIEIFQAFYYTNESGDRSKISTWIYFNIDESTGELQSEDPISLSATISYQGYENVPLDTGKAEGDKLSVDDVYTIADQVVETIIGMLPSVDDKGT